MLSSHFGDQALYTTNCHARSLYLRSTINLKSISLISKGINTISLDVDSVYEAVDSELQTFPARVILRQIS